MKEYSRPLKKPEARHRYIHVHKDDREFFPESNKPFSVMFHGKKYDLKVNHKDDIMTGQLYEKYQFLEGHRVVFTNSGKDSYDLQAPDTKPYPKVD